LYGRGLYGGRGWRGRDWDDRGWYGGGWYGPGWGYPWGWGLGAGLGLGLWLNTLPWDYETFWWDGVPYYYAADNYYVWNSNAGQYQAVQPPAQIAEQAVSQPAEATELYAYPTKGQSDQQQATDKDQCRDWARSQSGYNPADIGSVAAPGPTGQAGTITAGTTNSASASAAEAQISKRSDYLRAEAACLQGRGYTVR
jgi:hypothetical protein